MEKQYKIQTCDGCYYCYYSDDCEFGNDLQLCNEDYCQGCAFIFSCPFNFDTNSCVDDIDNKMEK